jgi:VWFA-related protein
LTVVVIVEFAQSFAYYYDDVITPAANFVRSLRPDDWAALVVYDIHPTILTDFTKDKEILVGELSRLRFPASRETALFDAVFETLKRLDKVDGKKAVYLLSDGLNSTSQHTLGEVLKKADASDTMIYATGLGQYARLYYQSQIGQAQEIEFLTGDNNIRGLAEGTGGVAFYPRFAAEYRDIYDRISKEMRNQYSIGFVPKSLKADGKFHKLRVEIEKMDLNHDGKLVNLTARHKKGYYAPGK